MSQEKWIEFDEKIKQLNLTCDDHQKEQFEAYYELLVEWNSFMNLTAITEWDEVIVKHFVDSVALGSRMDLHKEMTVIDVGTGAGFPGIPLKIMFPELQVVLLDSLNKRVKFLNEVIDRLGLEGITAVHSRAEDGARKAEYRDHFDLCVSRAVANLSTLSEYCLPYVKVGGQFISYKSGDVMEELSASKKAINVLGGKQKDCIKLDLPGTDIHRSFVVIEKMKPTPKAYPRKAGTASKNPIA